MLNYQWKKIEGPEMVPVLRQIYETAPQSRYPENPLLTTAVERLYELDTNRTRSLLLEEMKPPDPRLPYHMLALLPDATLPELDATLLDHLQHNGGRAAEELIARYSTTAILDAVKDSYAKRDAEMRSRVTTNPNIAAPACEPPLIAYFLRVDTRWGEKLFANHSASAATQWADAGWGSSVRRPFITPGAVWETVAIDALQDTTVPVKIDAVKAPPSTDGPPRSPRFSTPSATGTNGGKTAQNRMTKTTVSNRPSSKPRRDLSTGRGQTPTSPRCVTSA